MAAARRNAIIPLSALLLFACVAGEAVKAQNITYDGYRSDYGEIWFNAEKLPDGTFRITLSAPLNDWAEVHTDSHYAGYSVRLEQAGFSSVAYLHSLNFSMESEISVAQAQPAEAQIEQGIFGVPGQPPIKGCVGDTITLGQEVFSLRRLSPDSALIYLENEKEERTVPLSSIGSLRSEVFKLEDRLRHEQRMLSMASSEIDIRTLFLFILMGYFLIFGFILVGLLMLPRFVHIRPGRRHICRD
jgi:hypothetical protein